MWRRSKRRDMADVNMYTASRLGEMARSLSVLAKSCQDDLDNKRGLTKEDTSPLSLKVRAFVSIP